MKTTINYNYYNWGPFLYHASLQPKELISIKNLCEKNKEKDHGKNLAGLIEHEYRIDSKKLFEIILPYIKSYADGFHGYHNKKLSTNINIIGAWVNYMTKFESNPMHKHSGDLSFVIYTQVPDELTKEINNNKSDTSCPGTINFMYKLLHCDLSISQHNILPKIGDLLIFPASLNHCVNHFQSDGERISVSGNLEIK
mgnify:FL=1|jgi:hypothetical protein|tara:strand:- start:36 stop:626 length:591 start_codon:yes stop_codon:yes gene_type:complete